MSESYNIIVIHSLLSTTGKLPEDRVRYWNAYLLFYERIAGAKATSNRRSSRLKYVRASQDVRQDSLSELSELVHQGEMQVGAGEQGEMQVGAGDQRGTAGTRVGWECLGVRLVCG